MPEYKYKILRVAFKNSGILNHLLSDPNFHLHNLGDTPVGDVVAWGRGLQGGSFPLTSIKGASKVAKMA